MRHRQSLTLATAAIQDVISCGNRINSAALREADGAAHQAIRDEAHALLDVYLDHMADAGKLAVDTLDD